MTRRLCLRFCTMWFLQDYSATLETQTWLQAWIKPCNCQNNAKISLQRSKRTNCCPCSLLRNVLFQTSIMWKHQSNLFLVSEQFLWTLTCISSLSRTVIALLRITQCKHLLSSSCLFKDQNCLHGTDIKISCVVTSRLLLVQKLQGREMLAATKEHLWQSTDCQWRKYALCRFVNAPAKVKLKTFHHILEIAKAEVPYSLVEAVCIRSEHWNGAPDDRCGRL